MRVSLRGIGVGLAVTALVAAGSASAAVITVSSTADDTVDNGNCTLREAILSANFDFGYDQCVEGMGYDVVLVPAGIYTLTKTGEDDIGVYGDLDILTDMAVTGVGQDATVVDGNGTDRVFDIFNADVDLKLMTVRNGQTAGGAGGGCIRVDDGSGTGGSQEVLIEGVRATGCQSDGAGGVLAAQVDGQSLLTIRESAFADSGTGGLKGGLAYLTGRGGGALIERSSFTGSTWQDCLYFEGTYNAGLPVEVTLRSSTVADCSDYGLLGSLVDLHLDYSTLRGSTPASLAIVSPGGGYLDLRGSVVDTFICPGNVPTVTSLGDNLVPSTGWGCFSPPGQPGDQVVATAADLGVPSMPVAGGSWRPSLVPAADSPAVDAALGGCPAEDQDGRSRPQDDDDDGTPACTLGAVETAAPAVPALPFSDGFESGDVSAWSSAVGG